MTDPLLLEPRPKAAGAELRLRTGAWYGDRALRLPIPPSWQVDHHWPRLGRPLSDAEIAERLESPVGQPPIRELCRGKLRPVILVDDLNRPTPAARPLPVLLRQFREGGIDAGAVTLVIASGTHGPPPAEALVGKIGAEAASSCRIHVHDCRRDLVRVGRSSFGTPVFVDQHVARSDLVIGIGGLYPNHTAGFGGGSKLALGVLGMRSIAGLHYGHQPVGWGTHDAGNDFRRDLDEIAEMIGLRTVITLLVDGDREVVDLRSGDHRVYYRPLVESAKDALGAPAPGPTANVVVANAYPTDTSLTFVRMKGMVPLHRAPPNASRVVIASCSEGLGFHGLTPFLNAPKHHGWHTMALRGSALLGRPGVLARKAHARVLRRLDRSRSAAPSADRNPIWMYRPAVAGAPALPSVIPGMRVTSSWDEVVDAVVREQGGRSDLKAVVYCCASVQWIRPE